MNRKFFTGIIILMGISILGIIAVQLIWMNNAIKVKNELFNRSVNEALNNTVDKLEDLHNFGVVNRMVFKSDSLHWTKEFNNDFEFETMPSPPPDIHLNNSKNKPPQPVHIIRQIKQGDKNSRIEIKVDTKNSKPWIFSYQINSESDTDSDIAFTNNNKSSGNAVFIVNTDTIITDVDSLYNISMVKIDSMMTSLDTFEFFQPDISHRTQLKAGRLKRMANQVVTEISEWDVRNIDEE